MASITPVNKTLAARTPPINDESVLFESDKKYSLLPDTTTITVAGQEAENEETKVADQNEPANFSSDYQENDFILVELKSVLISPRSL
ncbi:hypothetical protein FQR65_LT05837 [Abscondita terminalis]|nr:hypothetical protein FQR65_LT05837 [Abscondita terminalis]